MSQDRDESGRFEESVSEQALLAVFDAADDPVLTAKEVAEQLRRSGTSITAEGVRQRLDGMAERGLVRRKNIGARAVGWWANTPPDRAEGSNEESETPVGEEISTREHLRRENREPGSTDDDELSGSAAGRLPHREAATAFFEQVHARLDEAIDALYLFGSVAHERETEDSDVDVLAVIADDAEYAAVDDQLLDIAYDVQLEYGVRVEVHSLRASEFESRREEGDPFVRTVVEQGTADV